MKRIFFIFKFVIIISLPLFSGCLFADIQFSITKNTPFALGKTVDVNIPTETKEQCLNFDEVVWNLVEEGALDMNLESKIIKNSQDLYRTMRLDAKIFAKAKFKIIDADVEMGGGLYKEYKNYSDSLSYLVHANVDFGNKEIQNPQLKPRYQQLIDEGKHGEFIRRCGTHFVNSGRYGTRVSALLQVKNLTQKEKKRIELGFTTGVGFGNPESIGGLSTTVTSTLLKQYREAMMHGTVSISAHAVGGNSAKFNKFAMANGDLKSILGAMRGFMSGIRKETAAPLLFNLVSMERFGLNISKYDHEKQRFFERAFFQTLEYESRLERIHDEIQSLRNLRDLRNLETDALYDTLRNFRFHEGRLAREMRILQTYVKDCHEKDLCTLDSLREIDFNIAWTSNIFYKKSLAARCLKKDGDIWGVQVTMDGEFIYPELLENYTFERESGSGILENLYGGYNIDYDDHTRGKIYGTLDVITFGRDEDAYGNASGSESGSGSGSGSGSDPEALSMISFQTEYFISVTDKFGRKKRYSMGNPVLSNCF